MERGVGTLTGMVRGTDGTPLGNIEISVTDGETTRTATSLTEGVVGSFSLPQLPVPATYTVSASGDGWVTATQQVEHLLGLRRGGRRAPQEPVEQRHHHDRADVLRRRGVHRRGDRCG